ncbi:MULTISPECIES: cation diffusion facilitator family transporter [Mesobacillus]|uniref:Zinc transporter ZitB n=1 Tax=Mesobacillus subterraneus TaxID=285983 RepID=A0A0D6ZDR5_9BACI|nr:cation diffusion facilitator family transporter [Mesobacillus subterraneus]KIY23682.1 zinc transporter ZitB [Mesobacillus subterraneus]
MGQGHSHESSNNKKLLLISFILIFGFMIVELIGGIWTNSLALISDAGHMLSDAVSLGLSLLAIKIGEKAATAAKTYGYKRIEILVAFLNGITLLGISIYVFWEAFNRFSEPPEVNTGMLYIAVAGLIVNIVAAWILQKGNTKENLNLRSAFLHVLGDMLGSVGAIVAGLLILFFNWNLADPIASIVVSILVLVSGWRVTKESVHILLEGAPTHINIDEVKKALEELKGVEEVHDLHIWSITSDQPSLSGHLVVEPKFDNDDLLNKATSLLKERFKVKHSTLQLEGESFAHKEKEEYTH